VLIYPNAYANLVKNVDNIGVARSITKSKSEKP